MRKTKKKNNSLRSGLFGAVVTMLWCVVATCSFSACTTKHEEPEDVKTPDPSFATSRTVLVYMVAENSLNGFVANDVKEMLDGMKGAALYPDDRIVLYIDDIQKPRIYMIDRDVEAESLEELTPVLEYSEDVNSSSADQLGSVIDYVKAHYAANSYGLVMWSHASGWIPSTYSSDQGNPSEGKPRKSFGLDNGFNSASNMLNGFQMNIPDLARVLEEKGGVDFLFFDACFMQCIEVAYELRRAVNYVIGSPAEIPDLGAYYQTMAPAMFKANNVHEAMLTAYYGYYSVWRTDYGIVISSVKTSALENYAAYMKTMVNRYREELMVGHFSDVLDYFRYGEWGTRMPDFFDMQGIMRQVLDEDTYALWLSETTKVIGCQHTEQWFSGFNRMLNTVNEGQCCGVSMFVPLHQYDTNANQFNITYLNTQWAKDVWVEE